MDSPPAPRAPWTYRALTHAAALPVLVHAALRAARDGGAAYLRQRYGFALPGDLGDRICLHCCSVGEVRAALPLARALRDDGQELFLSVATPTGRRMARTLLPELPCVYFPLDHAPVARRWLQRLRPKSVLVMETELWPNFFSAARRMDIPLALVNARLSRRTEHPPVPVRAALRHAAQQLRCILARSEEDAQRFAALGAPTARIENLGNLKYAAALDGLPDGAPISRPYILAASTHDDEEAQITKIWARLQPKIEAKNLLLVLLPRYPDRAAQILRQIEPQGLAVGLHSRDQQPQAEHSVYVADTLGEALWWMRDAAFVFVGGSLIARGGHNVLEPAALGKACAVGPHTEHFKTEVAELRAAGGLQQAADSNQLEDVFLRWLQHPKEAQQTGQRAQAHVRGKEDLPRRYLEVLQRYGMLR